MVFILVSVAIIILVILRNLILTTRMVIGELKCRKPSTDFLPGDHKDVKHYHFDRFLDILFIFAGFLHIPEHIYLMVYLYKFIGVYINWETDYKKDLWLKMREFVWTEKKARRLRIILLNGIVLILMLLVALLLPPISIVRLHTQGNVTEEYCSNNLALVQNFLMHAFHGVSFFTNTVVALTRWLVVFFTIMVGVMWRRMELTEEDNNRQHAQKRFSKVLTDTIKHDNQVSSLELGHEANDWEAVCCRHTKHFFKYMVIKKKVSPIYKIFRSFFVLQWIIHLIGLFSHIAQLVRPWIRNGQVHDANMLISTHQIYQLLYILYNGLALVISYICALKMNAYLRRYIRDVQQKQLDEAAIANSKIQYSLTQLFLVKVESVSKSSFLPRIPGIGLSISVESPGFVLSVVLSVFAMIGSLISF